LEDVEGGEGIFITAHTRSDLQGTYHTDILSVTWDRGEKNASIFDTVLTMTEVVIRLLCHV
jgi:hypothetical protein